MYLASTRYNVNIAHYNLEPTDGLSFKTFRKKIKRKWGGGWRSGRKEKKKRKQKRTKHTLSPNVSRKKLAVILRCIIINRLDIV